MSLTTIIFEKKRFEIEEILFIEARVKVYFYVSNNKLKIKIYSEYLL